MSDDCGDMTDEDNPICDLAIFEDFEKGQDGEETNIGIFTQDITQADFLWKRGSGRSTSTQSTGPPFDHSYFTPNGHYAFIRSSEQNRDEKDKAYGHGVGVKVYTREQAVFFKMTCNQLDAVPRSQS